MTAPQNRTVPVLYSGVTASTNVDTGNVAPLVAEGKLAPAITTQFADVTTYFKAYGVSSDPVTFEELYAAVAKAGDFNVDARAVAVANLLKAQFIKEERLMLGGVGSTAQVSTIANAPQNGLNFTIGGAIGNAPSGGTVAFSSTGGSIANSGTAAVTYYVQYTAVSSYSIVTGMPTNAGAVTYSATNAGESLPATTTLSFNVPAGTTTGSVTFTPPANNGPHPIVAWKVYIGSASTGPFYFAGYTTGGPLSITAIPTSGLQPPATDQSAGLSVSGGTGSSVEGAFNGVLAWLYGQNSGATIVNVNGAWTYNQVVTGFATAFQNAFADPDSFWVSPGDMPSLTQTIIGNANGQNYWFAATQGAAQADIAGGFRVARWLNPVTSKLMVVDVHAYLPQGTAIALTDQLPPWYVGNNVPDVWIWGGAMDYLEIDYQPTANNKVWISEIECLGAIHCFLPSQNVVFNGING